MKISLILMAALGLFFWSRWPGMVETGQGPLFPKEVLADVNEFGQFGVGSWGHVLVGDASRADAVCAELKGAGALGVRMALCQLGPTDFLAPMQDWLKDQFLNFPPTTLDAFKDKSQDGIAQLSMPLGPDSRALADIIRRDPLGHRDHLLQKLKQFSSGNLEWKGGFLTHAPTGRITIPVQYAFPPDSIQRTEAVEGLLAAHHARALGVHHSYLTNRRIIEKDLEVVGQVSLALLLALAALLAYMRAFSILRLVVPLVLGLMTAFLLTYLVYGKVHAIALSFASGVIGMGIDYGLHALFSMDKKSTWRSNLFGLLTTVAVFAVFALSILPVIGQMMFFASMGLVASFAYTKYLFPEGHLRTGRLLHFHRGKAHLVVFALSLVGLGFLGAKKIDSGLDRFNYSPSSERAEQKWFIEQIKDQKVFYKTYSIPSVEEVFRDYQATQGTPIKVESIAAYTLPPAQQESNLGAWVRQRASLVAGIPKQSRSVYAPFLLQLEELDANTHLDLSHPPAYLAHLANGERIINLWFAKGGEQERALTQAVPGIKNLSQTFMRLAQGMTKQAMWFIPLSVLFVLAILLFKYRALGPPLLCLVPLLFSLAIYGLCTKLFGIPIGFMSLMGLFMNYGQSVDYGIFTIDQADSRGASGGAEQEAQLQSALLLSAALNLTGFVPMVFCQHPILQDLGLALCIGMLASFYATFYILPSMLALRARP